MEKIHVGENGPGLCKANIRDCPIGGEHFTGENAWAEAEKEYAKRQGGATPSTVTKLNRGPVNEKSNIDTATIDSLVQKAMNEEIEYQNYRYEAGPPIDWSNEDQLDSDKNMLHIDQKLAQSAIEISPQWAEYTQKSHERMSENNWSVLSIENQYEQQLQEANSDSNLSENDRRVAKTILNSVKEVAVQSELKRIKCLTIDNSKDLTDLEHALNNNGGAQNVNYYNQVREKAETFYPELIGQRKHINKNLQNAKNLNELDHAHSQMKKFIRDTIQEHMTDHTAPEYSHVMVNFNTIEEQNSYQAQKALIESGQVKDTQSLRDKIKQLFAPK